MRMDPPTPFLKTVLKLPLTSGSKETGTTGSTSITTCTTIGMLFISHMAKRFPHLSICSRYEDFVNFRDKQMGDNCQNKHHLCLAWHDHCRELLIAMHYEDAPAVVNYEFEPTVYSSAMSSQEYEACLREHRVCLEDYQSCVRSNDAAQPWYPDPPI